MLEPHASDLVEHLSPFDFATTLERVSDAIAKAGLIRFAVIDHAAGAHDVGMAMPPTTVLVYGHPKGGTPIMVATPQAALDLPLRVLVRDRDDGRTVVSYMPIATILRRAGVPEASQSRLDGAQRILEEALL